MYDIYNYDEIALVNNADIDYLLYLAKVDRAKFLSYIEYEGHYCTTSIYSTLAKFKITLPITRAVITFYYPKSMYFGGIKRLIGAQEAVSLTELRSNNSGFMRIDDYTFIKLTKDIAANFNILSPVIKLKDLTIIDILPDAFTLENIAETATLKVQFKGESTIFSVVAGVNGIKEVHKEGKTTSYYTFSDDIEDYYCTNEVLPDYIIAPIVEKLKAFKLVYTRDVLLGESKFLLAPNEAKTIDLEGGD